MSCTQHHAIDAAEYLADPRADAFDAFRAHFPGCPECAQEVAGWRSLSDELAALAADSAHPDLSDLLAFADGAEELEDAFRQRAALHLSGCGRCRSELRALATFPMPNAVAVRASPAEPEESAFARVFGWMPAPAWAVAALALLIAPVVWNASQRDGAPIAASLEDTDAPAPDVIEAVRPGEIADVEEGRGAPVFDPLNPFAIASEDAEPEFSLSELDGVVVAELVFDDLTFGDDAGIASTEEAIPAEELALAQQIEAELLAMLDTEPADTAGEGEGEGDGEGAVSPGVTPPVVAEAKPSSVLSPDDDASPAVPVSPPREAPPPLAPFQVAARLPLEMPTYQASTRIAGGSLAGIRIDSAVRGANASLPRLQVMAPAHVAGLHESSPVLYWWLSGTSSVAVELTLVDSQSGETLLEHWLDPPIRGGLHTLSLAKAGVALPKRGLAEWYVSLVTDADRRDLDVVTNAVLRYAPASVDFEGALSNTRPGSEAHVFAAGGYWIASFDQLTRWMAQEPDSATLRVHRAALVEQARLDPL